MKKFNSANDIRDSFIKSGWGTQTAFEELTKKTVEKVHLNTNRKYFRMIFTGNIYDENGKIALYNL